MNTLELCICLKGVDVRITTVLTTTEIQMLCKSPCEKTLSKYQLNNARFALELADCDFWEFDPFKMLM